MDEVDGSEVVVRSLAEQGVKYVFGVSFKKMIEK